MLFIILATTFFAFLIVHQFKKSSRLPPGPVAIPVIGNVHQLVYYSWKNGGVVPMMNMYRKKYGNVYTLWFGPIPHVNVCDYETAHEVFVKHGNKYADKFVSPLFQHVREGRGVASANGESWQELRRFSLSVFRNMGVGKDLMEERIMAELDARCADIDKIAVDGVTVQQSNSFFDLTIGSIINSMLIGSRFNETTLADFEKMKYSLDESMKKLSAVEMVLPVWALQKLCPERIKFQVDVSNKLRSYVSRTALDRIKQFKDGKLTIDPESPQDLVDAFILKMESEPENPAYSEESLKDLLLDLWITGQETTTTTLVTAFNHFLHHPEVMDNIRDELMKVTIGGSRPLSLKDKNDTPYLNATIAEVQRHASILNMNFYKINHETSTIGGHSVDSGAVITAQLSVLHTNDETFKDSSKFDPSRFIENDKLAQQIIPFGVGKRSCLGESLARAELYLVLGNLLLRYKFRAHDQLPLIIDLSPFGFAKRPPSVVIEFIKINV